jgi:23S rRNA pseudouridine1911/1915/1917 synthase
MNDPAAVDADPEARREAVVPANLAGARFDQALAEIFSEYSRSRLATWIRAGRAQLDGRSLRPRDPVRGGEKVTLDPVAEPRVGFAPESIALDVLHQDKHLLVINKPAGLVVHPGAGNPAGTLQNALLALDPALEKVPRAGIVHRLDKDTSGALVVARTLAAHAGLVALLAARDIHRRYVAVVMGVLVAGGTIDAPIARHPRERVRMAVVAGGKPAITHYRVRERYRAHSLVQAELETGRTHQIRVHFAHIRHPVVGDPLYCRGLRLPRGATPEFADTLRAFRRQALHAESIAFEHPARSGRVEATAPQPPDFAALIAALRADAGRAA